MQDCRHPEQGRCRLKQGRCPAKVPHADAWTLLIEQATRLICYASLIYCACPLLQDLKPELVYARISGYGQTGPKASLPGYASVCEAYGGFR